MCRPGKSHRRAVGERQTGICYQHVILEDSAALSSSEFYESGLFRDILEAGEAWITLKSKQN